MDGWMVRVYRFCCHMAGPFFNPLKTEERYRTPALATPSSMTKEGAAKPLYFLRSKIKRPLRTAKLTQQC